MWDFSAWGILVAVSCVSYLSHRIAELEGSLQVLADLLMWLVTLRYSGSSCMAISRWGILPDYKSFWCAKRDAGGEDGAGKQCRGGLAVSSPQSSPEEQWNGQAVFQTNTPFRNHKEVAWWEAVVSVHWRVLGDWVTVVEEEPEGTESKGDMFTLFRVLNQQEMMADIFHV